MRFNFLDWMNMSMAVDIACLVYMLALTWKNIKFQKEIFKINKDLARTHLCSLNNKEKIELTIKNPQQAKRMLRIQK